MTRCEKRASQILEKLWHAACNTTPGLSQVSLRIVLGLHDSPRHYAAYFPDEQVIGLAPEALDLPVAQLRGLLLHELGHAIVHQTGVREARGYDARERQADAAAKKACAMAVKYGIDGVQVAGSGARGRIPRPKGLR